MKYIDANRLRKEIDHRIDILEDVSIKCAKNDDTEMHAYYHGKAISLQEFLSFIDSLQQEQPKRICTRCVYLNKTDDICEYPYGGKSSLINENGVYECNGFEEVEQQEQPSLPDDLDEAAREIVIKMHPSLKDCTILGDRLTRGQLMALVKAGAEWQKKQMLKDAVEGFVATHLTSEGTKVTVNSGYLPKEMCIKPGDKVRIIIVKEEK